MIAYLELVPLMAAQIREPSGELKQWHQVTPTIDGAFARETDNEFFRDTNVPFWEMKNADALIGNTANDNIRSHAIGYFSLKTSAAPDPPDPKKIETDRCQFGS